MLVTFICPVHNLTYQNFITKKNHSLQNKFSSHNNKLIKHIYPAKKKTNKTYSN